MGLDYNAKGRIETWEYLTDKLEKYLAHTKDWKATPILDKQAVLNYIDSKSFSSPIPINEAIDFVMEGFRKYHVHTPHPHYMGLFNPRANFASVVGDTITATINPQMAAWSHAPFANEVEAYMVRKIGKKFGFDHSDGVFTSGGAEANLTAVTTGLNYIFSEYKEKGIKGLDRIPRLYCSKESHHSILKAGAITGIGMVNVVAVPVNEDLSMKTEVLEELIRTDLENEMAPFMIAATAGTTGAGGFDPLHEIRKIADKYGLWMHTDAAYGGACIIPQQYRYLLSGIELSDSITFDAHKWLSVPMGAGIYLTRHDDILSLSYNMDTDYMPKEAEGMNIIDPFTHSIQWSRRFTGLKLYLSLLVNGWEGYAQSIGEDIATGEYLREKLIASGWTIYNDTVLPIVCFNREERVNNEIWIKKLVNELVKEGKMWLSVYTINGMTCARACITNYLTRKEEIDFIVNEINSKI